MDIHTPVLVRHRVFGFAFVDAVVRGALIGGMLSFCLGGLIVPALSHGYDPHWQSSFASFGALAGGLAGRLGASRR